MIEPVETVVGRELGVEDHVARRAAVVGGPEVDEAENLFHLLALADVGVGVAEHLAVGILGEEREDARLATTSLSQIMGFDHRVQSKQSRTAWRNLSERTASSCSKTCSSN